MKFIALCAFILSFKGVDHHYVSAYVEPYDTRAACVAEVMENYGEEYKDEKKFYSTRLDPAPGFACISTEGIDQHFPIIEKIAEGWDRV